MREDSIGEFMKEKSRVDVTASHVGYRDHDIRYEKEVNDDGANDEAKGETIDPFIEGVFENVRATRHSRKAVVGTTTPERAACADKVALQAEEKLLTRASEVLEREKIGISTWKGCRCGRGHISSRGDPKIPESTRYLSKHQGRYFERPKESWNHG